VRSVLWTNDAPLGESSGFGPVEAGIGPQVPWNAVRAIQVDGLSPTRGSAFSYLADRLNPDQYFL
jgi:hypothetical protein